ncbi:MAG TPA: serine/threonine-protein kinase [Anaeromyxobacteraceae bacterium]|nr:serine/threonine-protein kinase [Anaeromyxobacteraceae bacterium]
MRECRECRKAIPETARFCTHCGAAAAPEAAPGDPWIGRTVNEKFRVEALIGQGGMGRVYRARHLALDRTVVLKMLHRAFSGDPQVAQRFQREARAASRLDHPNSIAVLDFGAAEDGTLFMAMEHLGGRDLARLVAEEFPLPEARLVRIGAQILSALDEAHARGVIHRDLKPENVMVETRRDEPDFVKVLDFGIAKISAPGQGEPRLTQAGLVAGTPEYMSPEQARGAEIDARTDLYSMGVVLYQLATGDLPFQSETPVGFLTKHLAEVPVRARERRPEISEALDAVIARALEKDPAARFQSAGEMRDALLACAGARPAARPRPSTLETPHAAAESRRRRRPYFWLFAGAMGLALAGGGTIVLVVQRSARERAAAPPAERAPSAPAPTPETPAEPAGSPAAVPVRPPDRALALALFEKAEARRAAQDVEGAIPLYLAAEQADPGLAEVHKKLGLCYQMSGDRRRAAERYRRYLATGPEDAERVRAVLATLE